MIEKFWCEQDGALKHRVVRVLIASLGALVFSCAMYDWGKFEIGNDLAEVSKSIVSK